MSEQEIIWQDPPPRRSGVGQGDIWFKRLMPLAKRRGQWALIHHYDTAATGHATASRLRRGLAHIPAGKWEFTSRSNGTGSDVYARYLGPKHVPEEE